ncbi:MAG: YajQ family cyclic di-GMP-binding protein [Deltaproteobacteria bacterium]|nr:YajQ family cyclic di-GMP-binding protein [Deltaproteobacteria bacterium]
MATFDIVSKTDEQEVDNAVNQAKKEISTRYDFKDSKSTIEVNKDIEITIMSDDEHKLKSVVDILENKFIKRGVSLKSLDYGNIEDASGDMKRQVIKIVQGLSQDKAKEISKFIKATKLKVQSQIQGDQLRITAKKIDDLQEVITLVKAEDFKTSLQFVNMKS